MYQYPVVNHYEILGVAHNASFTEIRTAYLGLVKTYHPDNATPPKRDASQMIFKTITEAYTVLSKAEARRLYDKKLRLEDQSKNNPSDITNDNTVKPLWRKIFESKA